jgi:sugar fermentation stimulation protein A
MAAAANPLLVVPHAAPYLPGTLIGRYQRFLAAVRLDCGERVVAHCVNTGRMEGLTTPGLRVWLSHDPSPTRKLAYTWQLTELDGLYVGTNTAIPNGLVGQLLRRSLLRGLASDDVRAEQRYGHNSRIDFLLRKGKRETYVEVKNCHLAYPDRRGYFPDSESERATKHLHELEEVVRAGHRAVVIFVAQREDIRTMRPSDLHDPAFASAARRARATGVRFLAVSVRPTPESYTVQGTIPVDLRPYDLTRPTEWMKANQALAPAWFRKAPE